jgi:hypothetical protein
LSKRIRHAIAALGVPSGFALVLFAVPGPCTSFGDVDAAELIDAAAFCDVIIPLDFAPTEGGPSANVCEAFVYTHCCPQQQTCMDSDACTQYVDCVNDCGVERLASCTDKCGGPAANGNAAGSLASCETHEGFGEGGTSGCLWIRLEQ